MLDFYFDKLKPKRRLSDSWFDSLVALVVFLIGIVWSASSGKDLNWDQLHYHFYLAYSLFDSRIGQDFMPANGQSYLNPMAYAPFYWMVNKHWNSLLIASLLSIVQSLNVVLSYFIVKTILPINTQHGRLLAAMAAILTFLSPVLLMEIGTTFADASTAVLVMAAVLCGLHSHRDLPFWRDWSFVAGLSMGIATALKLSNLVFSPACAVMILLVQASGMRRFRAILLFGIGCTLGGILMHGYWGWQLWKEFGNPFFPYFGNVFPTDVFPKEGAPLERFLPDSLLDVVLVPFRMVLLRTWIYIENVAPDLRFAALVLTTILGGIYLAWCKQLDAAKEVLPNWRPFVAFSAYFLLAFGLWQWTSGNGRYGLVVSLLAGPMLTLIVHIVCRKARATKYLLGSIICLQILHLQNGDLRWSKGEWTPSWYDVSVPNKLRTKPYLYISVGKNSNSYILPFLSHGSALTNPIGQISFGPEEYGGPQLQQLFQEYKGRIRVLAMAPSTIGDDAKTLKMWVPGVDAMIARLGYTIDTADCETITTADGSTPIDVNRNNKLTNKIERRRLITCQVTERPYAFAQERARVTKIAKEVVHWCPKLFKPAYTAVEQTENGWTVNYPSTDSTLMVRDNQLVAEFFHSSATFSFGSLDEWQKGLRPSCDSFPDKPRNVYNFY